MKTGFERSPKAKPQRSGLAEPPSPRGSRHLSDNSSAVLWDAALPYEGRFNKRRLMTSSTSSTSAGFSLLHLIR